MRWCLLSPLSSILESCEEFMYTNSYLILLVNFNLLGICMYYWLYYIRGKCIVVSILWVWLHSVSMYMLKVNASCWACQTVTWQDVSKCVSFYQPKSIEWKYGWCLLANVDKLTWHMVTASNIIVLLCRNKRRRA